MQSNVAVTALGTNVPYLTLSGAALLAAALQSLVAEGFRLLACSSAWSSPAWPDPERQAPYVNAVALLDAGERAAEEVLGLFLAVEARFGRTRRERWAARTLDLDLIDFAGIIQSSEALTLPHPRRLERAFVLAPLAEAAPDWRDPLAGETAAALLARLGTAPGLARLGPLVSSAG